MRANFHARQLIRVGLLATVWVNLLIAAPHVWSGRSDQALAHVFVDIIPHIALQVIPQSVADIPSVAPGGAFPITARFNVAANTDRVEIGCVVSALHRAAVASSVDKIPVKKNLGCLIDAVFANPMSGASARAAYQKDVSVDVAGFQASPTNMVVFQSNQDARFNMDVTLEVHYDFDRLNMPQGQYGGVIKLVTLLTE